MANPPFTVEDITAKVRSIMRDKPEFNALLSGQETDDTLIELCIDLTVDDFKWTTPQIGDFNLNNFPSLYILVYGTVINVLRSAGMLQSRNNLNYSDGGITVASSDKAGEYQSWIDRFHNEIETKKKTLKMQLNAQQCYGGQFSEYYFLEYGGRDVAFGI